MREKYNAVIYELEIFKNNGKTQNIIKIIVIKSIKKLNKIKNVKINKVNEDEELRLTFNKSFEIK